MLRIKPMTIMICTWKHLTLVMDGIIYFMIMKNIWKDLEKRKDTISLWEICQDSLIMGNLRKEKPGHQWWIMKAAQKKCKNTYNFKNLRQLTILSKNVLCYQ